MNKLSIRKQQNILQFILYVFLIIICIIIFYNYFLFYNKKCENFNTNNKREILILDCNEIGCPLVLKFVYLELCDYFTRNGYNVKVINNIQDLHNNSIVFLGDTVNTSNPQELLNNIAPNAIYIAWYWQKQNVSNLKYFIYTYENNVNNQTNPFYNNIENHCPLLLRANEDPNKVGTYNKNIIRDYCYMGWKYKSELVPTKFDGLYHGVEDHSKFLSYDERKEIYLSSRFALGFQSDENIVNKHVSQRIYEGLAYGCIVMSESLPACEQTDGIVVHIVSKNDLEEKMNYYMSHTEELIKKQNDGYEFIKKYGTNEFAVKKFTDLINKLYNIII